MNQTYIEARPLAVSSPESLRDALCNLGQMQLTRDECAAARDAALRRVRDALEAPVLELDLAIEHQAEAIAAYVRAHPELVADGEHVAPGAGTLGTRQLPVSVHVDDTDRVIAHLQKKGLSEYLRVSVGLDRAALKKARPRLPGVDYRAGVQLVITPAPSGQPARVEL